MINGVEITLARYSYGDMVAERKFAGEALQLQLALPELQKKATSGKKLTAKENEQLEKAINVAQKQIELQIKLFAKCVVSLPQDLLVEGAPNVDDLDLQNPDTYLWLRPDAASALKSLIDLRINGVEVEGEN